MPPAAPCCAMACRAITLVKTRVISKLFPLLTLGTFFASSQESVSLNFTQLLYYQPTKKLQKNYLIYISNVQQSYHLFLCILLSSLSICYYSQFKALIADHLTTHLISQAFQFEFHFLFLTFL